MSWDDDKDDDDVRLLLFFFGFCTWIVLFHFMSLLLLSFVVVAVVVCIPFKRYNDVCFVFLVFSSGFFLGVRVCVCVSFIFLILRLQNRISDFCSIFLFLADTHKKETMKWINGSWMRDEMNVVVAIGWLDVSSLASWCGPVARSLTNWPTNRQTSDAGLFFALWFNSSLPLIRWKQQQQQRQQLGSPVKL